LNICKKSMMTERSKVTGCKPADMMST